MKWLGCGAVPVPFAGWGDDADGRVEFASPWPTLGGRNQRGDNSCAAVAFVRKR